MVSAGYDPLGMAVSSITCRWRGRIQSGSMPCNSSSTTRYFPTAWPRRKIARTSGVASITRIPWLSSDARSVCVRWRRSEAALQYYARLARNDGGKNIEERYGKALRRSMQKWRRGHPRTAVAGARVPRVMQFHGALPPGLLGQQYNCNRGASWSAPQGICFRVRTSVRHHDPLRGDL